ncbi:MAG: class I SAM-dependent methyltransferase, partial [Bacteroidota bacterium]
MQNNSDKCRICGSEELTEKNIGSTLLKHCNSCDIFYSADFPDESKINKYYEKDYIISTNDIISSEKRRIFRLPEQISLISEIKKYVKTPAKLLDIGCDKGFFLDEARRWDFEVYGIEPSTSAREYCKRVSIPTTAELDEVNDKFSAITMWHSLEHHLEPVQALSEIKEKLDNNGFLFIRVPAFDCFWRRLFKSKWIWFQPRNHYFQFTADSLRNMLQTTGFEVNSIVHQKPNTRFTKKMYRNMNSIFRQIEDGNLNIKNYLQRKYED